MTDVRIPAALSPKREAEIRGMRFTTGLNAACGHFDTPVERELYNLAAVNHNARLLVLAELDRVRAENARLCAERHETNEALADITLACRAAETERDERAVEAGSSNHQWEYWAREAERLQKRVAELEAAALRVDLRAGQLAEQRHTFLDLDPDSACCPPGFVCPAAHTAPELEATA